MSCRRVGAIRSVDQGLLFARSDPPAADRMSASVLPGAGGREIAEDSARDDFDSAEHPQEADDRSDGHSHPYVRLPEALREAAQSRAIQNAGGEFEKLDSERQSLHEDLHRALQRRCAPRSPTRRSAALIGESSKPSQRLQRALLLLLSRD